MAHESLWTTLSQEAQNIDWVISKQAIVRGLLRCRRPREEVDPSPKAFIA